jgi:Fe2+ or Zn2+ uptake regulation protein
MSRTTNAPDVVRRELRSAGLRVTPQRVALLTALRAAQDHATAEALQVATTARGTAIPMPTVYAVMADLVRAGLVRDVRGEGGATRFDANVARHHHLACSRCGALLDIPCAEVDGSGPCLTLADDRGWQLDAAEVTFRGLCPACRITHHGGTT